MFSYQLHSNDSRVHIYPVTWRSYQKPSDNNVGMAQSLDSKIIVMGRTALLKNIQDFKTAISVWLERTTMLPLVANFLKKGLSEYFKLLSYFS